MDDATPALQALTQARAAAARPQAGQRQTPEEIRRTAESFEAMFLAQMLSPMFDGLSTDGEFGGGAGERAFRPMLIEEYGRAIMRAGGVGIADAVAREMMRLQGIEAASQRSGAPGDGEDGDGARR